MNQNGRSNQSQRMKKREKKFEKQLGLLMSDIEFHGDEKSKKETDEKKNFF